MDRFIAAIEVALGDWVVDVRPLIFSHSPGVFDERIAYMLRVYGGVAWDEIKGEDRPVYGDVGVDTSLL